MLNLGKTVSLNYLGVITNYSPYQISTGKIIEVKNYSNSLRNLMLFKIQDSITNECRWIFHVFLQEGILGTEFNKALALISKKSPVPTMLNKTVLLPKVLDNEASISFRKRGVKNFIQIYEKLANNYTFNEKIGIEVLTSCAKKGYDFFDDEMICEMIKITQDNKVGDCRMFSLLLSSEMSQLSIPHEVVEFSRGKSAHAAVIFKAENELFVADLTRAINMINDLKALKDIRNHLSLVRAIEPLIPYVKKYMDNSDMYNKYIGGKCNEPLQMTLLKKGGKPHQIPIENQK